MDRQNLRDLLSRLQQGKCEIDQVMESIATMPFVVTPGATVDTHRALRQGDPEVIYGPGKSIDQIVEVIQTLAAGGQNALATRISPEQASAVCGRLPQVEYNATARILWLGASEIPNRGKGTILVVSAGSADAPVAAEAVAVATKLGNKVEQLQDVGVAGIHRLLAHMESLRGARVIIVVAGMEGALPSVVGGLVDRPVIAVPTSVGYGASLQGVTALLGMLTSCASNVSVVNIDNGYGAANVASLINRA